MITRTEIDDILLTEMGGIPQEIREYLDHAEKLMEPKTCVGCLHLRMKNVPHTLRICRFCTRNEKVQERCNLRDHYISTLDYDKKKWEHLRCVHHEKR